jgi:hypothetical protein
LKSFGSELHIDDVCAVFKKHGYDDTDDSVQDLEARELFIARAAYMKEAQKRFRDNIPMVLRQSFKEHFFSKIKSSLQMTESQLERILFEEDSVKSRRAALVNKKTTMKEAEKLLRTFMGTF